MLKVLTQLGEGNNGDKLPRRNADELGHEHHHTVTQQVVEQVVAVVTPHGHLPLRVVQGVQPPPPLKLVLTAVHPVVAQINGQQVDDQTGDGLIRHARPHGVEVEGLPTGDPQRAEQRIKPGRYAEKQDHPKQAQPVNRGVEHIDPNGGPVGDRFHRAPALQGADDGNDDHQLKQAHQQPAGGVKAIVEQVGHAQRKHGWLHQRLEQFLLENAKRTGQRIKNGIHRAAIQLL